ncbi:N-acetylmannosamine kinase [Devosia sp. H5989]|nr:N-acetylmannosamine kinase [Devosia sp. H5989]
MTSKASLLASLEGGLIVSCQPVDDGPMDSVEIVVAMALAARDGGARALRVEGAAKVAAVVKACDLPVVAIIKRDFDDSPVRITPLLEDVAALADAGAAIIAVDGTDRERPVPVATLLEAIHARGCLAMADLSNIEEAKAAKAMGFDVLGTTMSGYTGGPVPAEPDFDFVTACRALGGPVVAEGRFNSPQLAGEAIRAGASAVCVGSAITRQEHVTGWFLDAVNQAASSVTEPVLALDIGGTKSMLALVQNAKVIEHRIVATQGAIATPEWFAQLASECQDWGGRYASIGAAVTGVVDKGQWKALNPATLDIPSETPIIERLQEAFALDRVMAANDAQAAAWGEYRFGAGRRLDMMFVTVSSGIGGGVVLNGKLLTGARGLAGSLGQVTDLAGDRLEKSASGFGIARRAAEQGRAADTRLVFEALAAGEAWAETLVSSVAEELANALVNSQKLLDVEAFVLGGGVGLLKPFRTRLDRALASRAPLLRPTMRPAALGTFAGAIGIADLATRI